MKLKRYGDEKIVFTIGNFDSTGTQPLHIKKILKIDNDSIISENDMYYKYLGKGESYILDITYFSKENNWNSTLVHDYGGDIVYNSSRNLVITEVDSVLHSWNLRRTND